MSLRTFQMLGKDRKPLGEPVPYHSLPVVVGGVEHKLALHKDDAGHWRVSCPRSGAKVLQVQGCYRGITTTSVGLTLGEVRELAREQVVGLAMRVTPEKFNSTIAAAAPPPVITDDQVAAMDDVMNVAAEIL